MFMRRRRRCCFGCLLVTSGRRGEGSGCGHLGSWVVRGALSRSEIEIPDPLLEGKKRDYWYYIPSTYKGNSSLPLVMDFHGYYDDAASHARQESLPVIAERQGFLAVFPNAWNDSPGQKRWLGGWGDHGYEGQTGRRGPICHPEHSRYVCYKSCARKGICSQSVKHNASDCHSGSCVDDDLYVHRLLKWLLESFCVDLRRIHVAGMSAGAVYVYGLATSQLGRSVLSQLASLVLVSGNPFVGRLATPPRPLAIMDIHGTKDDCVPANVSNSYGKFRGWCPMRGAGRNDCSVGCDYWYYEPQQKVLRTWEAANGCSRGSAYQHFPTASKFDKPVGRTWFWCAARRPSNCSAPVVRCTHDGGHTWPFHIDKKNHPSRNNGLKFAELMWWFMSRHRRALLV